VCYMPHPPHPHQHLVQSTDYEAPNYSVFSSSSLPHLRSYSPQQPVLRHTVCIISSMWETKFRTHTKQQVQLYFCTL
jgi:hypothetical protein